jgi:hypothetical protein
MKTDLKVELFLIQQTYFTDNHTDTAIWSLPGEMEKREKKGGKRGTKRLYLVDEV